MPHYENACIYKIKHNEDYDDENIYIGSTCDIIKRRYSHKTYCNNEKAHKYNYPIYQYIRGKGGWDAFVLIKIHDYKCNSKNELEIEERRIIDMLKPKLNKQIPKRSNKEWREENKEVLVEKKKEWYQANKEFIAERDKKYYEANKEIIAEKTKEYREANKEKRKEKCKCDICGLEVRKDYLTRHKKSQKCLSVKNNM